MKAEKLDRYLRALPRALHPKRDLWPGIERSILEPERLRLPEGRLQPWRRQPLRLLAVAAGVVLVAGSVFLALRQPRLDNRTVLLVRVQDAERQYQEARKQLLRSLQDLAAEYGDESVRGLQEDIAAVDGEIASARAAVVDGRDGQDLVYRLAALYRAQAGCFEQATSLVHSLSN